MSPVADTLSESERSALMSRIGGKDTKPELVVRRTLHSLGYRYRLHVRGLPGSPDLVFPGRNKALLVHGCFWHSHNCAHGRRRPSSNVEFWNAKCEANRERDARKARQLRESGWEVETVWECETKQREQPWILRITQWLGPPGPARNTDDLLVGNAK